MKIQKYINGNPVKDSEIDGLSLDFDIYKKALNSVRSRMESKGNSSFARNKTSQDNLEKCNIDSKVSLTSYQNTSATGTSAT